MSKKVITIARAYGSGGRLIGREVASKLGYAFYDKGYLLAPLCSYPHIHSRQKQRGYERHVVHLTFYQH